MDSDELKTRLKGAALRIIRLVDSLPNSTAAMAIAKQEKEFYLYMTNTKNY
jgi:hypothetical protein